MLKFSENYFHSFYQNFAQRDLAFRLFPATGNLPQGIVFPLLLIAEFFEDLRFILSSLGQASV